jgi:hypothetical protein
VVEEQHASLATQKELERHELDVIFLFPIASDERAQRA